MIISNTVLREKAEESEEKLWDYLLDNAENDNEIALVQNMLDILAGFGNVEFYFALRNESLELLGIDNRFI